MRKKISNKQYAEALYDSTKELKGEKLNNALKKFVTVLVANQKLKQSDNIIKEFEKYAKKQTGVVEIEVKSARKLDKNTLEKIKSVFGNQVEAIETIDTDLLGGVSVRTEDKILDASLKTQLANLKDSLI